MRAMTSKEAEIDFYRYRIFEHGKNKKTQRKPFMNDLNRNLFLPLIWCQKSHRYNLNMYLSLKDTIFDKRNLIFFKTSFFKFTLRKKQHLCIIDWVWLYTPISIASSPTYEILNPKSIRSNCTIKIYFWKRCYFLQ